MVELVDTLVLGTSGASREGSSPFSRTMKKLLGPQGLKAFLLCARTRAVRRSRGSLPKEQQKTSLILEIKTKEVFHSIVQWFLALKHFFQIFTQIAPIIRKFKVFIRSNGGG